MAKPRKTCRELCGSTPPDLALRLSDLAASFSYPLGDAARFRISHDPDYTAFVGALGESVTFVIDDGACAHGVMSLALRELHVPGQGSRASIYICDLKVRPGTGRGFVLGQLFRAAHAWGTARAASGFGVVMKGTERTPGDYSGRLGMPRFRRIGSLAILRWHVANAANENDSHVDVASESEVRELESELSVDRARVTCGDPTRRSRMRPIGLRLANRGACGILEDTRRAKRLFLESGDELVSAHLSAFAYSTPAAGAQLVAAALERAKAAGMPAVFAAVDNSDAEDLLRECGAVASTAPAEVWAAGVPSGHRWSANTAEI